MPSFQALLAVTLHSLPLRIGSMGVLHVGPVLRKLFNHLRKKAICVCSQALSSIDYQRIVTASIPPCAGRDAGRHYALVVCE